jgi:hypothetical protein
MNRMKKMILLVCAVHFLMPSAGNRTLSAEEARPLELTLEKAISLVLDQNRNRRYAKRAPARFRR